MVDTAELKLWHSIQNGEAWGIAFCLKTIGKDRGYIERQEVTGADGAPQEFVWCMRRRSRGKILLLRSRDGSRAGAFPAHCASRSGHIPRQYNFIRSPAKRRIVRAGRRSGKTTGVAILSVEAFLQGKRVLYAAPVSDQINRWWKEVTTALREPIEAGIYKRMRQKKR